MPKTEEWAKSGHTLKSLNHGVALALLEYEPFSLKHDVNNSNKRCALKTAPKIQEGVTMMTHPKSKRTSFGGEARTDDIGEVSC